MFWNNIHPKRPPSCYARPVALLADVNVGQKSFSLGGRKPKSLGPRQGESSRRPGLQQQKEGQGRDTRHSAVFIGGRHVPGSLLNSGATGKNAMAASPSRPFWNEMGHRSINELRSVDRPI